MAGLAKILKTDVMADLDMKALAQVLRSQGRHGDTVLAHITPKEARKLKREGGSGSTNPATGLPEFFGEESYDFGAGYGGAESFGEAAAAMPADQAAQSYAAPDIQSVQYVTPGGNLIVAGGEGTPFAAPGYETLSAQAPAPLTTVETGAPAVRVPNAQLGLQTPESLMAALPGTPSEATTGVAQPGYFERLGTSLQKQLEDPATLARLGLGLGVGGFGAFQQQRAAAGAKQAKRETAAIGAPYRAQGQELIEQARRGEMSPASMQAYEAMRAQIAQQTARQGGVGAAQGAAALERLRAQLIANQYNLGLNVANIGDRYLAGAIQTGQQANQQLMTATNNFYSTLGSMLSGPTGQAVATAVRP